MVTALNLLYPGKKSKNRFVRNMKFLPQASIMDKIVAASSHHLYGPFRRTRPMIKSRTIIAPTYTGPLVLGCVPQYWDIPCTYCDALFCLSVLTVSESLSKGWVAPPLRFGIRSVSVSSTP